MACPGVYKPGPEDAPGKCYTYDVLTSICIEIRYTVDVESAEEKWEYAEGCYEHDSPVLMERAVPGRQYEFDYIPIEVRADDDPYTVVSKHQGGSSGVGGIDLSYFRWLGSVMFGFAMIGTLVFGVSFILLKNQKY
jgi:hypothetical protein